MISIIVPIFNGAVFIKSAYLLLLEQNVEDFEIIFVDNNSTDDSVKIIENIVNEDWRVSLFFEKIQGAASARNKGLEKAKGEFIYFFDVDDQLFDSAINSLYGVLIENPEIDSVHGNMIKSTQRLEEINIDSTETGKITIPEPYQFGIKWMHYGKLPGTPSFLHRKRVFEKIGKFNSNLSLGEDAAFHVKLGMECQVAHLDKNIFLYYRHAKSTVSKQNEKQIKEFAYWEPLIHEHVPYLLSHKVPIAFKKMVLVRVYSYTAKMLASTKTYSKRQELLDKLLEDIRPLKIPLVLKPFISLISASGSLNLYKVYYYYVLNHYMKHHVK